MKLLISKLDKLMNGNLIYVIFNCHCHSFGFLSSNPVLKIIEPGNLDCIALIGGTRSPFPEIRKAVS